MLTKKKLCGNHFRLFLMLLATAWIAGCTPPGPRALLDGKRLIERGKYEAAVEKLKIATQLMRTNALAWNYLGLACHHSGQSAAAIEAYQKALKLNPDLVVVHYDLGCLLLEENRRDALEGARNEFTAFTLHQGNSLEGWLKLGATQLRLGELSPAEKSFNEALRLSPQNPEALNDLGVAQLRRNRARDAAAYFNSALKQQPDYAPSLLNLAAVFQVNLNNRTLALQKYQEYLALNPRPENWEAVNAIARQLELELRPPPAHPPTNAPLAGNSVLNTPKPVSNNSSSHFASASNAAKVDAHVNSGKPVASIPAKLPPEPAIKPDVVKLSEAPAVKVAEDVAEPQPAPTPPLPTPTATATPTPSDEGVEPAPSMGIGVKSEKRGFFQKINPLNLFRREPKPAATPTPLPPPVPSPDHSIEVASVSTNSSVVSQSQSISYSPPSLARYQYKSPAKPAPGNHADARALFDQGVQAQHDRRSREALALFQAAIRADPGFFEAQSNLGLAAYDLDDMPQSLLAYETALAIKPDSFNARFNFALALKKAGYIQDAAEELERLLLINPTDEPSTHLAMAHLTLANLYAEQFHRAASARPHYLKVLELDPHNSQSTAIRYWLRDNP